MKKVNKEKADGYVLLGLPDTVLYAITYDQSDLEMARTNLVALAADVLCSWGHSWGSVSSWIC